MKRIIVLLCIILLVGCSGTDGQQSETNQKNESNYSTVNNETNDIEAAIENNKEDVVLLENQTDESSLEENTPNSDREEESVSIEETSSHSKEIMVSVDILNVRSTYDIESERVSQVKYGDIYEILEVASDTDGKNWYKVTVGDSTGWIASWFCYDVYTPRSLEDFVNAIGSNRLIKLSEEMAEVDYLFTNIQLDHMNGSTISKVKNLIIEGNPSKPIKFFTSSIGDVLAFENVSNVTIRGLDIGHITKGYCQGDVLSFKESSDILVEDSILFGSGRIGIDSISSQIHVKNTKIWDCFTSAFSVDLLGDLVVDQCIIEEVPSVFKGDGYLFIDNNVLIKNTIINSPLVPGAMYNDRIYIEGMGLYYMNQKYNSIILEDTLYMPRSTELENPEIYQEMYQKIDNSHFKRLKAVSNDSDVDLDVTISYETLEDKSRDYIESVILDLAVEINQLNVSFDHIYGTIYDEENVAGLWTWDMDLDQLSELRVHHGYTKDILGIDSIDFEDYLARNFELKEILLGGITVELLPSEIVNDEIIHKAVFDIISSAGDFPEYMGTLMFVNYNQSRDEITYEIDHKISDEIVTLPTEVTDLINQFDHMMSLFKEYAVKEASKDYYNRYDLSEEDIAFIETLLEEGLTGQMRTTFIELLGLEKIDGMYYSKNPLYYMQLDFSGYKIVCDMENGYTLYMDNYGQMETHSVEIVYEKGYKINGFKVVELMNRTWDIENRFNRSYLDYQDYLD